ncbi:hypothetical protein BGZ49_000215 [Haplosporangium sp. Z 27]|nr:hypothetical protein BGZ49_000215 [Haplosporangium sp. Z 27]
MKPQFGQSKLSILKHAPSVHRKRRPVELHRKQEDPSRSSYSNPSTGVEYGGRKNDALHRTAAPAHGRHPNPPSLLRRQTTRHKSFMQLDLPSMQALRREPSMMELDPPATLFAPAPTPSHFMPGPWAFFQAAEAQREQQQAQMQFLTRLQELRLRDEQLFVQLMAGFAKECPVQFGQLAGFMKKMEMEMEMGAGSLHQQQQQQKQQYQQNQQQQLSFFQNQHYNQSYGQHGNDLWNSLMSTQEHIGSKVGLLALAQAFGNQVTVESNHGGQFRRQQQSNGRGRDNRRGGRGGRGGHGRGETNSHSNNNNNFGGGNAAGNNSRFGNGGSGAGNVPSLRRGKTFQQQQQAMKQLTAYQRHLYQQVQQMHGQKQQGWQGSGPNSGQSTPMAYELMQYAAMLAGEGNTSTIPPLLLNVSSPTSSLSSASPVSPISPLGYNNLMTHLQQHQQQQQQQQNPSEMAAMNIQLNMGSSRRSRYKPPPLRSH